MLETSGVWRGPGVPVLKYVPSDFLVRENLVVALHDSADSGQRYLMLRKQGYTTSEAIGVIAGHLGVPRLSVTYAGLKDEDGITEQLVAVPRESAADLETGWRLAEPDRWLELHHYGFGAEPLAIGRLEGNSFRTVLRGLDEPLAEEIVRAARSSHVFVNYYDTQRFGVPHGPKWTDRVGAAILDGDWGVALDELIGLRAPESEAAAAWSGTAEEFFRGLDPRTVSFYLAALASRQWNDDVRAAIRRVSPDGFQEVSVEGVEFLYLNSPGDTLRLLVDSPVLPYRRYSFVDGEVTSRESERTTVVQTRLRAARPEPDELLDGTHRLTLGFPLPSGCYATAALRQLLAYTSSKAAAAPEELVTR